MNTVNPICQHTTSAGQAIIHQEVNYTACQKQHITTETGIVTQL